MVKVMILCDFLSRLDMIQVVLMKVLINPLLCKRCYVLSIAVYINMKKEVLCSNQTSNQRLVVQYYLKYTVGT